MFIRSSNQGIAAGSITALEGLPAAHKLFTFDTFPFQAPSSNERYRSSNSRNVLSPTSVPWYATTDEVTHECANDRKVVAIEKGVEILGSDNMSEGRGSRVDDDIWVERREICSKLRSETSVEYILSNGEKG